MQLARKDVSDWIKIAVLVGTVFMAYQSLKDQIAVTQAQVALVADQSERMERYLQSGDVHYWERVKKIDGGKTQ